jgi:hypothetical protein
MGKYCIGEQQGLNYILLNPVRAGIVKEQTHYIYSSAAD